MDGQYPIIIILAPLLAGLLVPIVGMVNKKASFWIVLSGLIISLFATVKTVLVVMVEKEVHYFLGSWPPPIGIEYVVDHLNGLMLIVIGVVAVMAHLFGKKSVEKELGDKLTFFYTLFVLMITGLLGMTVTGDVFNLYVLLEISALTGYALLALGKGKAYMATFEYVMMGTIGACFYLLGVGYLLLKTGSLNMGDLHNLLLTMPGSQAVLVGFILIMLGVWVKMALFPMHGWLPNAYTYAPIASSCVVAPLVTKVSVYIMIRMMFTVFSSDYVFNTVHIQQITLGLAVVAIIMGSLFALSQKNLKKMLTYLIIAEVGYMVGGAWLGNAKGLTGAVYHIVADAMMTLCLFMAIGCIIYKVGNAQIENIKGIFRKMPLTMVGFVIGAFSMIGIPPTCGFFSKWYLLSGAYEAGQWPFFGALLISSLVNAILFFRIIEVGYFRALSTEKPDHHANEERDEAPLSMVIPLLVVAGLLIGIGLYTDEIVSNFVQFTIPEGL